MIIFYFVRCKKIFQNGNKAETVEYGDASKMNDKIGILLEFNDVGLDITFFINKVNMGVAFKSLPHNTYYPCVVLGYDGTRVRMCNKATFPGT